MTSTTPTTRPVDLTDAATYEAQAEAWIERNGMPDEWLVSEALVRTEAWGDPNLENGFRQALLAAARKRPLAERVGVEAPSRRPSAILSYSTMRNFR